MVINCIVTPFLQTRVGQSYYHQCNRGPERGQQDRQIHFSIPGPVASSHYARSDWVVRPAEDQHHLDGDVQGNHQPDKGKDGPQGRSSAGV